MQLVGLHVIVVSTYCWFLKQVDHSTNMQPISTLYMGWITISVIDVDQLITKCIHALSLVWSIGHSKSLTCIFPRRCQILYSSAFLFFYFFSVRLLSVLRGHSVFVIPATTTNDLRLRRIFYPRFYPLHLFSYLNSWERASIFPFECSVLNKGTTGTICITSLVGRGPWLGDWTRDLPHSKPALYH